MALLQARHLDLAWRSRQMLELINLAVWRKECIERKYLHWEKKMNLFACHPMVFRPSRVPVVDKSFMPLHLCFDVVFTPSCCWLKKRIILKIDILTLRANVEAEIVACMFEHPPRMLSCSRYSTTPDNQIISFPVYHCKARVFALQEEWQASPHAIHCSRPVPLQSGPK